MRDVSGHTREALRLIGHAESILAAGSQHALPDWFTWFTPVWPAAVKGNTQLKAGHLPQATETLLAVLEGTGATSSTTSSPCRSARSGIPSPASASTLTAPLCCPAPPTGGRLAPMLRLHPTRYCYTGDASPSAPGGITLIYKDLIADEQRTRQVIADVKAALSQGRNCLVLTNWTAHLDKLADALRAIGHDPVILRGGLGAKARAAALAQLQLQPQPQPGGPSLLAVATGPYAGEGFDCPAPDTLFLAAPIAQKGRLVQYAGRILRPYNGKATAEVHDYHDELTGVLASSLAKRTSPPALLRHPVFANAAQHSASSTESPRGQPRSRGDQGVYSAGDLDDSDTALNGGMR